MDQSLRDMYMVLDKELKALAAKGTVSPTEMENAYKAICSMEKIKKIEQMDMNPPYSERRSSYGYDSSGHWPMSYEESMRRGRDSIGRFTSMDGRFMDGSMRGGDNYSGHSVRDRMIDRLERMRDEAQSQSERMEIEDEIKRIRMGG